METALYQLKFISFILCFYEISAMHVNHELTSELERRITVLNLRCCGTILNIWYTEHVSSECVPSIITHDIGKDKGVLTIVECHKLNGLVMPSDQTF